MAVTISTITSQSYSTIRSILANTGTTYTIGNVPSCNSPGINYGSGGYFAIGEVHNIRVYAYKILSDGSRVYSSNYASSQITDANNSQNYTINWSWNAVSGATGYRILKKTLEGGYNYDHYADVLDIGFTDTGPSYFTSGSTVTPTSTILNTGLTDTQSPARTRTDWILSAFPDEYGDDFPDYPIVTIETNPDINLISLGQSERMATISPTITVYAKKAIDLDTITDDVINQLFINFRTTLESASMFSPTLGNTSTQTVFRDKGKVHIRTIPFNFKWIG
jgi:hypothetical protein